jgi:outer membrane biosynthesis protein TonB
MDGAMSSTTLAIRRRIGRPSPLRDLRIGDAARSGRAARMAFPGIAFPEPANGWRRAFASALAITAHVSVIAALFALAWLAPTPEKDEPIPIQLIQVRPPPPPPPKVAKVEPPPAPKAAPAPAPKATPVPKPTPAPAPKALAERRSVNFAPSAQTVTPQIVNPSVIAKAAPAVDAKSLQSSAPREIQSSAIAVQAVQAVTNVAAPIPTQVDIGNAGAPALRGPVQAAGVAGPSVGPKAIASPSAGESVGTGRVVVSGDGSSVREGVVTGRDVLGSPDGARVASANTNVGAGNLRGGGEGTTLGGDTSDCDARPEVRAYMAQIRERTLSRWAPPPDAPTGQTQATLSWQLDVGGSASSVQLVSARDKKVGATVVDALRSASPFPPMNDRVRCLAERRVKGTFSLQVTASSSSVAN